MAALLCGLSLSVTSCKDDDKDSNEQRRDDADPLDTDEAQTAWRWLSSMTNAESLTTDWAKKTYEPVIGIASENNANTRIVVVTSLDEAKMNFASIAGVDANSLGAEVTVNQGGVGKLTWTPSKANAQNLAEVAVDTKLIPHLQKIIYCTHDQIGQNGLFSSNVTGTAYYRFGDVVREKSTGYYWVCVRPSFEQGDKGDSHWINVFNYKTGVGMPKENIKDKWNKNWGDQKPTILLPTQLKYSREHIYNLSNLVWALLYPERYHEIVGDKGKGLGGFDYQYHSEEFLKIVGNYWADEENDIWLKVFGHTSGEMMTSINGLNFFYQGYTWKIGDNAAMWLYKSTEYESKMKGSESGDKQEFNMNRGFDITRYAMNPQADYSAGDYMQFPSESPIYGDEKGDGYWVVRYKRGDALDKNYSPYHQLTGFDDVYRYNEKMNKEAGTGLETTDSIKVSGNAALPAPVFGCVIGENGKFYKDEETAKKLKVTPAAVVVYLGKKYVENNRDVPNMPHYNGLAMSVYKYGSMYFSASQYAPDAVCYGQCTDFEVFKNVLNGLKATDSLSKGHCLTGKHTAQHFNLRTWSTKLQESNDRFSPWFIPSVGQWILVMKQFGYTWDGKSEHFGNAVDAYKKMYDDLLKGGIKLLPVRYLTTTEQSDKQVWNILFESDGTKFVARDKKTVNSTAIAFTAFTWGEGATDDSDLLDLYK